MHVCVNLLPSTAKVIRRRSQFIVSSERLEYKSSSLTTRPRRLLNFNAFTCKLFSGERFRLIEPLVYMRGLATLKRLNKETRADRIKFGVITFIFQDFFT